MRTLTFAVAVASALGACASAPVKPPPLQAYHLGLSRADYRDYRGGHICSVEPRWLIEELRAPLAIVGRFTNLAAGDPDGAWSAESTALLSEGAATLSPMLDALEADLDLVRRCSFADSPAFAELLRSGPERCAAARSAIPYVARLLAYVDARSAREAWRKDDVQRNADARTYCSAPTQSGPPRVCQSVVDCDGTQEWVFDDGTSLTRAVGSSAYDWVPGDHPAARPSGNRRKPAPLTLEDYVAAKSSFTGSDRCPALPDRPAPPAGFPTRSQAAR
jgi:hypothetical protein